MTDQNLTDQNIPGKPILPDINEIALEAGEIWSMVARKYREIFSALRHQRAEKERLFAINAQLLAENKKLKQEIGWLQERLAKKIAGKKSSASKK